MFKFALFACTHATHNINLVGDSGVAWQGSCLTNHS